VPLIKNDIAILHETDEAIRKRGQVRKYVYTPIL